MTRSLAVRWERSLIAQMGTHSRLAIGSEIVFWIPPKQTFFHKYHHFFSCSILNDVYFLSSASSRVSQSVSQSRTIPNTGTALPVRIHVLVFLPATYSTLQYSTYYTSTVRTLITIVGFHRDHDNIKHYCYLQYTYEYSYDVVTINKLTSRESRPDERVVVGLSVQYRQVQVRVSGTFPREALHIWRWVFSRFR